MSQKLVIGPINKGTHTDRTAFIIDNDSFPLLVNAYQWRGRIKRKRGTSLINRLTRYFTSSSLSYGSVATIPLVAGAANILTGFGLQATGNIIPGSVAINNTTTPQAYTDNSLGALVGGAGGTINYATGAITISGGGADSINATFRYYPDLPVMGLEPFSGTEAQFPETIGFDTTYSYFINNIPQFAIYDISFYKNPPTLGSYTAKTIPTPTSWNGQNYQQFLTAEYQGCMWATNGLQQYPADKVANIGMQFQRPATTTYTSATTVTFTILNCPLVQGDFVFANEFTGTSASSLNLQTGYVSSPVTIVGVTATVVVTFPNAAIGNNAYAAGILQYLTNRSDATKDCLRWYDGDPTNGSSTAPIINGHLGWVNFMPPLSNAVYNVGLLPSLQYYLVGAALVFPFKDRLIFFGPIVQTSGVGAVPIYLEDTIIYSQNGTPFYTCSFTGDALSASTTFTPLLVPSGQGATPTAWFEDLIGFGGFLTTGLNQPITTVANNEDVLMLGFPGFQTRLVYSGNDSLPFNLFMINAELGASSTFSSVNLDRGVITIGPNGISISSQTAVQRIDLDIPDQIFEFNLNNNGPQRVCVQRDFINEWIYMSFASNTRPDTLFPNQTLQYNYRDQSWATFYESYTTYGQFKQEGGFTWEDVPFTSWNEWTEPWNAGALTAYQPEVIAGNQQGYVIMRDQGTAESVSLYISAITNSIISSPNHGLNQGDFILISGCIGTITVLINDVQVPINGTPFQIVDIDANNFRIGYSITGSYIGGGQIKRYYIPKIMTKQFPTAWGISRKTRIGPQQYLFTKTANSQITLQIFLSQDSSNPYNTDNDALVYSNILYTCPESTNLGLTPYQSNLNTPTASSQSQIWHRINSSLIGDTVQIGFTLSDEQMLDPTLANQIAEIELHSIILEVSPSQLLV